MKWRKTYRKVRDKKAGKTRSSHRVLAKLKLARPLAPGEIVHGEGGDSTNDVLSNLLVLPSQRYHAHTESHLRCAKRGMPSLFPELFQDVTQDRGGTLFESVIA